MGTGSRRVARALPFVVLAVASTWAAGRAPTGRRSPEFDWSVTAESAVRALGKTPHATWMLVLFLLALTATGLRAAPVAVLLTLAVGLGWELAETTVPHHHAGLVDLLPDVVTVAVAFALVTAARAVLTRRSG